MTRTAADSATPLWQEDHISQVPALQLLQNLGWTYLTPVEALKLRGGKESRAVLTGYTSGRGDNKRSPDVHSQVR